MMSRTYVSLKGVHKHYGPLHVLDGIDLNVRVDEGVAKAALARAGEVAPAEK